MTQYQNDTLWQRLDSFAFDERETKLTFARRLVRENGWSTGFAERVIQEYKRFCYLACRTGHSVTPSDQVDQAWHLHLVYTDSYWRGLCDGVLERPLHHGPTAGGATEGAKYWVWYQATLESYRCHFGHPPPADIWPPAEERFGEAAAFRRVNTARHWILPKPAFKRALPWGLALLLAGPILTACVEIAAEDPSSWIWLLPVILVLFIVKLFRSSHKKSGRGNNKSSSGCDTVGCGDSGCGGCS